MSTGNEHLFPDSRLADRNFGCFLVDWELPSGGTVRLEVAPVYCANCGKLYGVVPKENTAFTFWLCGKCYETYGAIASTYVMPDDEFCRKLAEEMDARYGRTLTEAEVIYLTDRQALPRELELLARESPYPALDRRPRG